jgi:hypothetical protein
MILQGLCKGLEDMRKPDFFIVGAPRCGTTAMYNYLQQHPDIFMSQEKELNFFGSDLKFNMRQLTEEDYLSHFSEAPAEKKAGDSSVIYLYSKEAAHEIKDFVGSARIIIMLRNPVHMMYSLHSHFVYLNQEDITDFARALEAEHYRKQGFLVPDNIVVPRECLLYREMARFSDQVKRYLTVFGREGVHIVIFDDFVKDPLGIYVATLRFLNVDTSFQPEFRVINRTRHARSKFLMTNVLMNRKIAYWFNNDVLPASLKKLTRLFDKLQRLNSRPDSSRFMDPGLERKLKADFAPEVRQLSELVGKDLTHWTAE